MQSLRTILQKVNEAKKNNEFIEFHSPIAINITCFKQIVYFFICKIFLQLVEAVLQLFMIYNSISILIYGQNPEFSYQQLGYFLFFLN